MRKLREPAIKQFYAYLDQSLFTRHSFECSFNNQNGETVKIIFKENPEYRFIIKETNNGNTWVVTECPGIVFTDEEENSFPQFSHVQGRVSAWTQRILEDYMIRKEEEDQFAPMRKSLEDAAEKLENPETPFNNLEAKDWQERLESLIKQFEKLKEEKKVQQAELNLLKHEVGLLKDQIGVVPKKLWVKSAGNKIINIFEKVANSKAGALVIEHVVKALLGSDGK